MIALTHTFANKSVMLWSAPPSQVAHLVIDCQRYHADPNFEFPIGRDAFLLTTHGTEQTQATAERIAEQTPKLHQTGLSTILGFSSAYNKGIEQEAGGLHVLTRDSNYLELPKTDNSIFRGSNIEQELADKNISTLLISGVSTSLCVYESVMDGLAKEYNVAVLTDCIAENRKRHSTALVRSLSTPLYVRRMEKAGALMVDSDTALSRLQNQPHLIAA